MYRDRIQRHRRSLPSTTTNSMLSASSPTSAPPSLTTSPWTQRSTRELAASSLARLTARMWTNPKPSVKTKMAVYYMATHCYTWQRVPGSETWTKCRAGEKAQYIPPVRSIRHILGTSCQDRVSDSYVHMCDIATM